MERERDRKEELVDGEEKEGVMMKTRGGDMKEMAERKMGGGERIIGGKGVEKMLRRERDVKEIQSG